MPDTHVLLINCTMNPQLIELLPDRICAALAANNGRLLSSYWTVGMVDMIAFVDLESELLPMLVLQTEAMDVTSVVAMRAFSQEEAQAALTRWIPEDCEMPGATADDGPAEAAKGGPGGKAGR